MRRTVRKRELSLHGQQEGSENRSESVADRIWPGEGEKEGMDAGGRRGGHWGITG